MSDAAIPRGCPAGLQCRGTLERIEAALTDPGAPLGRLAGHLEREERRNEDARAAVALAAKRAEEAEALARAARATARGAIWRALADFAGSTRGRALMLALAGVVASWLGLRTGLVQWGPSAPTVLAAPAVSSTADRRGPEP